ncbi:Putative AC transposase [Glycine soja]|nr:hypothetical protein JHK87_049569 [Glycine soja]KHN18107.1 Putative AC transposase [Glycine soja]
MARVVLAIPVSTIASESSFSARGRILNPYQTSLTPRMVQVLVCMQDWLKGIYFSMFIDEDFKELEKFEQDMVSPHEGVSSTVVINLDD